MTGLLDSFTLLVLSRREFVPEYAECSSKHS